MSNTCIIDTHAESLKNIKCDVLSLLELKKHYDKALKIVNVLAKIPDEVDLSYSDYIAGENAIIIIQNFDLIVNKTICQMITKMITDRKIVKMDKKCIEYSLSQKFLLWKQSPKCLRDLFFAYLGISENQVYIPTIKDLKMHAKKIIFMTFYKLLLVKDCIIIYGSNGKKSLKSSKIIGCLVSKGTINFITISGNVYQASILSNKIECDPLCLMNKIHNINI
jgi:hypothetical protein